MRPLEGITVLDFSQFLAGPSAAMRLADLGARVIKVERPNTGDICRQLYISNLEIEGESTLFHSINRNKQSYAADLKNEEDRKKVEQLIANADVMIENFRPGVMARLGLGFDVVREINPKLVYATVSGYGSQGPWVKKPGQDLLAQAMSGLTWLTGNDSEDPTPMGLSIADLSAGAHLVQGVLACLVRRGVTGKGGRVEVSLMESVLDLQFEVLTTHLNDGGQMPHRSAVNNAHAYVAAPYGIYRTSDGHLALAMGHIVQLGTLLQCDALLKFEDSKLWFTQRDTIKTILKDHLKSRSTRDWLDILEPADIWCAEVMDWARLRQTEGYKALDMEQTVICPQGTKLPTLRCPIRIDGEVYKSPTGAPAVGQHTDLINQEIQ